MDIYYLVILISQILAVLILSFEILYTVLQKPSIVQLDILLLTVSTLIMMIGYLIEIFSIGKEAAYVGVAIAYIGKPFVMLGSTLFIAEYCGFHVPRRMKVVLGIFSAIFPILIFTNGYHFLYYSAVEYCADQIFSPLVMSRGPLYYLYMFSVFAYTLVDLALSINEYLHCRSRIERAQILYLFGMIASGIFGYVLYLSDVTNGYDSTMAGCVIGSFILFILFFRFRLLDVVTTAKDRALDQSSGGLIVFDARGRVAYTNATVNQILSDVITVDSVRELEGNTVLKSGGLIYSIKKQQICVNEHTVGSIAEINNITDSYAYAARLEQDVKERTEEILHIQRSVIGGIANIVEARNGETGSHIIRTATYVGLIAQTLQKLGFQPDLLTDEYISRLVDAAPLHDIGKISISDTILLKPGKLTPEEFQIMKGHSAAGVEIIERIMRGVESDSYISCAEDVAHYHHEKWDGTGYPDGLSGERIPLSARIMAVADVYDALRSERCYKKAMDKATSKKIIEEGAGTHFDPAVVAAFRICIDQIEAVD